MRKINLIVHHYSATYADQDFGEPDIKRMHIARGFRTTGYHYVIKRDGTIQRGRPDAEIGAHVSGHNSNSIGICCIGGLERATGPNVGVDNRTPAQIEAVIRLTKELLVKYPGAQVVGHRDLAATQCPGFDVKPWWQGVMLAETLPARTDDQPEILEQILARLDQLSEVLSDISKRLS